MHSTGGSNPCCWLGSGVVRLYKSTATDRLLGVSRQHFVLPDSFARFKPKLAYACSQGKGRDIPFGQENMGHEEGFVLWPQELQCLL